ncbi:hypothetical protein [Methylocella sp.]|uniref:hypothetical protein n=1 Tax=Methylocella sp. TaxID=1978226 RepID=UPI003784FD8C
MTRKKTNAAAFDDILAGLRSPSPSRAEPAPAASSPRGEPAAAARAAPAVDVSWLAGAQARARAAQAAHFARAADSAEKAVPEKPAPEKSFIEEASEAERAPDDARADGPAREATRAETTRVEAPKAEAPKTEPKRPEPPKLNPVHAMRRLVAAAFRGFRRAQTPEKPQAAPAPARPAPAPRDEDAAIAAELGLRSGLAIDDLRRIRRDFAKKNHPDRFAPALRGDAARRMTIANMLIDQQMKRGRPQR